MWIVYILHSKNIKVFFEEEEEKGEGYTWLFKRYFTSLENKN